MNDQKRAFRWAGVFFFLISGFMLWAQLPDQPPYNGKNYPDAQQYAWYETPGLYIGLVVFLLLVLYFLRRGRQRAEHRFMGRK